MPPTKRLEKEIKAIVPVSEATAALRVPWAGRRLSAEAWRNLLIVPLFPIRSVRQRTLGRWQYRTQRPRRSVYAFLYRLKSSTGNRAIYTTVIRKAGELENEPSYRSCQFAFLADTAVIPLGTILPRSEIYRIRAGILVINFWCVVPREQFTPPEKGTSTAAAGPVGLFFTISVIGVHFSPPSPIGASRLKPLLRMLPPRQRVAGPPVRLLSSLILVYHWTALGILLRSRHHKIG